MSQPMPGEEQKATPKEQEAAPEDSRQERAARQQRLQEAKARLQARTALQGRITDVVVALILIGALAFSIHGCRR